MDKAILLQKQVRDNSEDLQREFLEMQAWEDQMKKKDLEIRSSKDDKILPPVRCKKKKKATLSSEDSKDEKPTQAKRISGSDYNAWNKFDADKACRDVEGSSMKEKEEKIYEIPSKDDLKKEHEEATKFKEEGNDLVQKKEYAKAVGKYSAAIKIFSQDATFYANRALCQLKLNNLYSAESDCTAAIRLDNKYVKAYHRRATARIELKSYKDAEKDLQTILELEPLNKEAVQMLSQVQKRIEQSSKPMTISGEEKNDQSSMEKKIGESLFGKKSSSNKNKNMKVNENKNENENQKLEQVPVSITKDEKTVIQKIETEEDKLEKMRLEKLKKSAETKTKSEDELPSWLPKLKKGASIVYPLVETPHRHNQTLKRIPIKEIPMNESIFKDVEEVTSEPFENNQCTSEIDSIKESKNKNNKKEDSKSDEELIVSFPPPPKSSVAFLINWRKNISSNFRYKYLKQIVPEDLPDIFKESMESSIFSDILILLNSKFKENNGQIYDYLHYLAKVKRFRALILFMTQADKEALKNLFEYCKNQEGKTDEEVNNLRSAYEM